MPLSSDGKTEERRAESAAGGGREKRDYVREMFEQIAPSYDRLNHLLSMTVDRRWRRLAIAKLRWQLRPDGKYLDLCAGTMDVAAELGRLKGFNGHVVAADFAEPMLRAGRGKTPFAVAAPVVADALRLPIRDATVDGVIVAFGARNLADLDAGLREALRVLRPGSRLVILEFANPPSRLIRALYNLYFHHVLPRVGGAISGHRTAYSYLPKSVAHFPATDVLAARMQSAGFSHVSFQPLTFGIAAIHVGERGH